MWCYRKSKVSSARSIKVCLSLKHVFYICPLHFKQIWGLCVPHQNSLSSIPQVEKLQLSPYIHVSLIHLYTRIFVGLSVDLFSFVLLKKIQKHFFLQKYFSPLEYEKNCISVLNTFIKMILVKIFWILGIVKLLRSKARTVPLKPSKFLLKSKFLWHCFNWSQNTQEFSHIMEYFTISIDLKTLKSPAT